MWNDTDIPIAHLISFRCYGSWLHGDERGSINRLHNQYQSPYLPPNAGWKSYNESKLKSEPETLNAGQRKIVNIAIREVCEYRSWALHALNAFKAYATKHLRQNDLWKHAHSPWADKGSRRRIWNEQGLNVAIEYVANGQGKPLPDFD